MKQVFQLQFESMSLFCTLYSQLFLTSALLPGSQPLAHTSESDQSWHISFLELERKALSTYMHITVHVLLKSPDLGSQNLTTYSHTCSQCWCIYTGPIIPWKSISDFESPSQAFESPDISWKSTLTKHSHPQTSCHSGPLYRPWREISRYMSGHLLYRSWWESPVSTDGSTYTTQCIQNHLKSNKC